MKNSEKVIDKTPSGGVYFITYFFDENNNPTSKDKAKKFIIQEFDKNDNMLKETISK